MKKKTFFSQLVRMMMTIISLGLGLLVAYFFLIGLFYWLVAGIIIALAYKAYGMLLGKKTHTSHHRKKTPPKNVIDVELE
ncbi:hypothetical protein IPJ72_05630 [Candidatus Peregrinibacteria bacterium]|nr:MAG: hypothetical protein IPJ72_05630 [Candidatus Peregrinibacteria bacterium]